MDRCNTLVVFLSLSISLWRKCSSNSGTSSLLAVKEDILRSIKTFIALESSYFDCNIPGPPPFPRYIHYPFRGLSKGGHWHARSLACLWDLQVTLPVTPRKLGLTTLTGPNSFLPAIRPWPTSYARPRKISSQLSCFFHRCKYHHYSPMKFIAG